MSLSGPRDLLFPIFLGEEDEMRIHKVQGSSGRQRAHGGRRLESLGPQGALEHGGGVLEGIWGKSEQPEEEPGD